MNNKICQDSISLIIEDLQKDALSTEISEQYITRRLLATDSSNSFQGVNLYLAVKAQTKEITIMLDTIHKDAIAILKEVKVKWLRLYRIVYEFHNPDTCFLAITLDNTNYKENFIELVNELRSQSNLAQQEFLEMLKFRLELCKEA